VRGHLRLRCHRLPGIHPLFPVLRAALQQSFQFAKSSAEQAEKRLKMLALN